MTALTPPVGEQSFPVEISVHSQHGTQSIDAVESLQETQIVGLAPAGAAFRIEGVSAHAVFRGNADKIELVATEVHLVQMLFPVAAPAVAEEHGPRVIRHDVGEKDGCADLLGGAVPVHGKESARMTSSGSVL